MKKMKAKRTVLLDMDGTAVHYDNLPFHSSWDALARVLRNKEKIWHEITKRYIDDPIKNYRVWSSEQVALLKGISVADAERFLFPIPYSLGFREFFLCSRGEFNVGIITHGVEIVAKKINEECGFDGYLCNPLGIFKGKFSGIETIRYGLDEKDKMVADFLNQRGLDRRNVLFVGDNFNDLSCRKYVEIFVAFNPKDEKLKEKVDYIIHDFRELRRILNAN